VCPNGYYSQTTPTRTCVQTCTSSYISYTTKSCVTSCPVGTYAETSPAAQCTSTCDGGLFASDSPVRICTTSTLGIKCKIAHLLHLPMWLLINVSAPAHQATLPTVREESMSVRLHAAIPASLVIRWPASAYQYQAVQVPMSMPTATVDNALHNVH
jgi:hypothetical protein